MLNLNKQNSLRKATLMFAFAILLAGCASNTDSSSKPTATTPVESPSAMPSVPSESPSPQNSHPTPDCGKFVDNSNQPVGNFASDDVIYYLFACNEDNRVIVRVKDGQGGVVHADLFTSYSYGIISFDGPVPVETQTFLSGGGFNQPPTYWGTATDLHMDNLVRIAGPSTDIGVFYNQDCADYMTLNGAKDCSKMDPKGTSYKFIESGEAAKWINEYAS